MHGDDSEKLTLRLHQSLLIVPMYGILASHVLWHPNSGAYIDPYLPSYEYDHISPTTAYCTDVAILRHVQGVGGESTPILLYFICIFFSFTQDKLGSSMRALSKVFAQVLTIEIMI